MPSLTDPTPPAPVLSGIGTRPETAEARPSSMRPSSLARFLGGRRRRRPSPVVLPSSAGRPLVLALLALVASVASADDSLTAAIVSDLQGDVVITRAGTEMPANPGAPLLPGDALRTGQGTAELRLKSGALIQLAADTFWSPDIDGPRITGRHHAGRIFVHQPPGRGRFRSASPATQVAAESSAYVETVRQKILFAQGPDLWLMNRDGSGRAPFLAAPAGQRLGRTAFSHDGRRLVYEAWDTRDRLPARSSRLVVANPDGSDSRVILDFHPSDPAETPSGYSYAYRFVQGPSFSPDDRHLSVALINVLQSQATQAVASARFVQERHVMTIPATGGRPSSINRSYQELGSAGPTPADPWSLEWPTALGASAIWTAADQIAHLRSGRTSLDLLVSLDTTDRRLAAWPIRLHVKWQNEPGLAPTDLTVHVDGQPVSLLPALLGYGQFLVNPAAEPTWRRFSPTAWNSPSVGSWYGPVATRPLNPGVHVLVTVARQGAWETRFTNTFTVPLSPTNTTRLLPGFLAPRGPGGGIWTTDPEGTRARHLAPDQNTLGSSTWTSDGRRFAADTPLSAGGFRLTTFDAEGRILSTVHTGRGPESLVGNWDLADRTVVAWSGSSTQGDLWSIDPRSGASTELGPGEFPSFAPLHRVEVAALSGVLSVTDASGFRPQTCLAGRQVSADFSQANGAPQRAQPADLPFLTAVQPAWGTLLPTNQPVLFRVQFSEPVAIRTAEARRIRVVLWPTPDSDTTAAWEANTDLFLARLQDPAGGAAYQGTLSNAVARGLATFRWNASFTQLEVSFPGLATAANPRTWGEFSLDLTGLRTTTGLEFPIGQARTRVEFVEPDVDHDGLLNTVDPDLDNDGMPNEYESLHALEPARDDGDWDADGDGRTNLEEYVSGTDPRDPLSRFACTIARDPGGNARVTWPSATGRRYTLQGSSDLRTWIEIPGTAFPGTGETLSWPVPSPASPTSNPRHFYRVRVSLAP